MCFQVTCTNNQQISERSMWNVEQHAHKKLNNEPVAPCQVSFWDRFTESHAAMAALHLHFTPTDLSQTSRAWQWPIYTKVGGTCFDIDAQPIYFNFILNCKMYKVQGLFLN